ncbi:MAG: glycosyltransferase family 2 protein [Staphylococcus chromogenes]|nr:glycosyltransferase family 2 protein [Staphylococcus chromogenes]
MYKESICAIVVTYNRKELLVNCLNALISQTYPVDHIVIVNNASQDGTIEFLSKNNWLKSEKITLLNLDSNEGGAGGFYAGIEFAHQKGFNYLWLMDDDGYPSSNCLEKLTAYMHENCYIGPMVLDTKTQDKLSFALRVPNSIQVIDFYSSLPTEFRQNNVIKDIVLPFNGTLIAKKLVDKMGFIKKDYFIWGDDKEYTIRAKKFNADILTVIDAIFYHPADSSDSSPMFFGKLRFNNTNSKLKLYCFCRNAIDTFKQHYGLAHVLAFFGKATWFFAFSNPNCKNLFFVWRAMWHGFKGDFSHHREYL